MTTIKVLRGRYTLDLHDLHHLQIMSSGSDAYDAASACMFAGCQMHDRALAHDLSSSDGEYRV